MKLIAIYLAVVGIITAILLRVGPVPAYLELANNNVKTKGTVVRTTCGDHMSFQYKFSVGAREFKSHATDTISKICTELTAGEAVTVFYLPSDPTISTTVKPSNQLANEAASEALAAIIFPAFGMWAYWRRKKRDAA